MKEYLVEKARRMKEEEQSYEMIRKYLGNAGASSEEITEILRFLDEEEMQNVFRKQEVVNARNTLIAVTIISVLSILFGLYRNGLSLYGLLSVGIPVVIWLFVFSKYRKAKKAKFSISNFNWNQRHEEY